MKQFSTTIAICIAFLTVTAYAQPPVSVRMHDVPKRLLNKSNKHDAPTKASESALPKNAGPLQKARFYYDEKSYQLAVNTADQSDTSTLSTDANRELLYLKARALQELHKTADADDILTSLIKEESHDAWAGRAHWHLQAGLNQYSWLNTSTSHPLEHLHSADRILTDLKPDDLKTFYLYVINSSLVTRRHEKKDRREYVMSFFDKIIPLLTGKTDQIAEIQLRRQEALNVQRDDRTPEERLAGLRGIVSEFPNTRAAAKAQFQVGQFYINKREFKPALYELAMLTNQFAGTEEAKQAAEEIEKIKRPEAAFTLPGQFRPDEKITFMLSARNTAKVHFTAIPFDIMKEMKKQKTSRLDLEKITGKPAFKDDMKVDDNDDYLPTSRTVTLNIKKRGAYVLRAEAKGKVTCDALLLISGLVVVGNTGPNGYEFWTVDAKTGKPKAASKIEVAYDLKSESQWVTGKSIQYFTKFKSLKTNSDGFADFAGDKDNGQMFVAASNGDDVALLDNINWSRFFGNQPDQPFSYLYTDRPVYRPEQKVYWRAIIRQRVGGEYAKPDAGEYRIVIRDPQYQEVFQDADMKLSEFGTINGEFKLPAGAPLGQYQITVFDTKDSDRQIGNGQFRVEEYKKPEFEVSVESATDFAKVGDKVKAEVQAKYLFASPVAEATVKYTVHRRKRFQTFWGGLHWHLNDNRDLGWFDEEPNRPPTLHGSGGTIVAKGEGKLDNNGKFTLTFDSTVPDNELDSTSDRGYGPDRDIIGWPPSPSTWDFQVEVTVTDPSRRNIDASQVIPVGTKALNLAAKTERRIVTPGDNARVELKSMNLAEKPVPTSGTLYIEKLVWNKDDKKDDITTVSSQAVNIEASGSLVLNWRVPDDLHGRLRFAYIVDDPFGGESFAYANFYAVSEDDTDISTRYHGVEIIADKTQYTVGETARIMILSEFKDADVWYWIDTGSWNLQKQVMPLPHRTSYVSIPITEALVPNSMIHIVAVHDSKIVTDKVELIVPPTSRVIDVQVTPESGKVESGQESRVSIKATDENGEPVTGEFSLSIFDQAITYIAPDSRSDIRKDFYGMRRRLPSNVRASLDAAKGYGKPMLDDTYRYLTRVNNSDIVQVDAMESPRALGMAAPPTMVPTPAGTLAQPTSRMAKAEVAKASYFANDADKKAEAPEMPTIRSDFRDSMFWSPTVRTDADGSATVSIKYPDSLTTWKMVAVGLTADTRVGNATTETIAQKKVLVRLQTPRFFRERDQVTVSGNLHNYTDSDLDMKATLRVKGVELDNGTIMPLGNDSKFIGSTREVTVPAGEEKRVDWTVKVESANAGNAVLNLMALSSGGSDSMQTTVPLLPHGIDKFVAWNGTSRDEATTDTAVETSGSVRTITRTVSLPAERVKETSKLEITVNPSLASSIRDAIPYMIDYPYGCVEQTMSRFMPAAVAARAFQTLGYPLDRSMKERLPKVTVESLKRLRDMQLPGGGWGWWANDDENLYMTTYVMYGLTLARDAEVSVAPEMFDSGIRRLAELRDDVTSDVLKSQKSIYRYPNNLHDLMFAEYVLTLNGQSSPRTIDMLWSRRDELSAQGLAMLARAMGKLNRRSDAEVALRNLENMAVRQPENNTLRWGRTDGWRWYDNAVEATAVGLMAYLELKPDDPAVDQAMKWLVLNRQGSRWKSTRDTAQSVLALTEYMLKKKEAAKPVNIEVRVGSRLVKTLNVTPQNFWDFDGHITLRGDAIPDGDFHVSFTVHGEGNVYYSIFAEYFTLEENIKKTGNEIYVTRSYEKLNREQTTETVKGKPSTTYKNKWLPIKEGDTLDSGDEIRVILNLKSLNDYQYLVFEDPKPAGMEPVALQSGSRYGDGLCSNMELRDAWIAFFITTMKQGEHKITYRMRAEIPGTFHTMPTTGYAMYFPPLRTNSDEAVMKVK